MLLERESAIDAVVDAFARASEGSGQLVVVGGEAGIGKTSLLRHVADRLGERTTVLWGACDSLSTPRALGPLLDVAAHIGGELADLLVGDVSREAVFKATLRMLSAETTRVVFVEDAHWADGATIDLLTFLRRRIDTTRSLLVVTYRDDEVGPAHPLRAALAGPAGPTESRLHLESLSVEAVGSLAGTDVVVDAAELHRVTGGNPFFVTEVLAAGTDTTPATVRDAVLARAAQLPPAARAVLDAVAIIPVRAETWLIDGLVDHHDEARSVDICVDHGVLRTDGDGVTFRHELARIAVRDGIAPVRRRELHQRALAALADPPTGAVDEARAAHHAFEAGDAGAVLRHAPRAAAVAARRGAHRQAVEHLDHASRYVGRRPVDEQIALWRDLGIESHAVGEFARAVAAYDAGIALCRSSGARRQEGEMLARASASVTSMGRQPEAESLVADAVAALEPLGPSSELAYALTIMAAAHMLARRFALAEAWGQRALALQEDLGRTDLACHTLVQMGIAALMAGDDDGLVLIERGQDTARQLGIDHVVALGYSHIGSGGGEVRRYELAVPALEVGLAFAAEHDLLGAWTYMAAWQARCHLEQGRWSEAGVLAGETLASPWCSGIARMVALTALGRLRARRGDPGAAEALDESLRLAREGGQLQRMWPTAVARAEAAWLEGNLEAEVGLLEEAHQMAVDVEYARPVGELSVWLVRAGRPPTVTSPAAEPDRMALAGRLSDAADAWQKLGCSFEAGVVMLDSDDPELVRGALDIFEALGSRPAAKLAANRLRTLGGRVPRGPNAATRGNAAGLTGRELDVLALLVDGLRNAEIAARLVISPKTVDHHVSNVLTKLGVSSRHAAAAQATKLGVLAARDGEKSP